MPISSPLTIAEVSKRLSLSEYSCRVLLRTGQLRGFKASRWFWRIDQKDLENYIEAQKDQHNPDRNKKKRGR